KRVMRHVETRGVRVSAFEAFKQLLVAGNVCLHVPEEGPMRVYRLDNYVCKRDPSGTLLELILRDEIAETALPEDVLKAIPQEKLKKSEGETTTKAGSIEPPTESVENTFDLYTYCFLDGDEYVVFQEVEGVQIPGSEGTYPAARLPFIALRMIRVDGESYGRSYCEEYLGDLSSLEALSKALVEYTAVASRILIGVNPNGATSAKKVATAKS